VGRIVPVCCHGGRGDDQAVCRGASEETGIVRRLGIVDLRLAESFLTDVVSY
jgi:hypothetical protein